MAQGMKRLAAWWGRTKRRSNSNEFRAVPAFETMETRALMAAGIFSPFAVVQTSPTTSVIRVTAPNATLLKALQTFLTDLEATFGANGTGATAKATATLQADLSAIADLAGTGASSTQAVQSLNNDVAAITATGTITAPQKLTLLTDLETIAINSGISGSAVISAANQVFGVGKVTLSNFLTANDLTDPNAISSTPAGATRGQDTSMSTTLLSPNSASALPAGGILGSNFRKLSDDLKAELAKSQAITSAQKAAIKRDFSEIAKLSHRPSDELLTTLQDDLNAAAANGWNAASRTQIVADVKSVLQSAGLSETLIAKTLADFQPVLDAADLPAASIETILSDLAKVLASRPRAAMPLGSWFLGK